MAQYEEVYKSWSAVRAVVTPWDKALPREIIWLNLFHVLCHMLWFLW